MYVCMYVFLGGWVGGEDILGGKEDIWKLDYHTLSQGKYIPVVLCCLFSERSLSLSLFRSLSDSSCGTLYAIDISGGIFGRIIYT